MLAIQNRCFAHGAIGVLDDVSMVAPAGRITCILGRNGVGKTTLLMNAMGLLRPGAGAVFLGEEDVTGLSPDGRSLRGLGLVPQGRRIFPKPTVEENLRVVLAARGYARSPVPDDVFELFPVLRTLLVPSWRRPLRRPAATAGDRSSAHGRS